VAARLRRSPAARPAPAFRSVPARRDRLRTARSDNTPAIGCAQTPSSAAHCRHRRPFLSPSSCRGQRWALPTRTRGRQEPSCWPGHSPLCLWRRPTDAPRRPVLFRRFRRSAIDCGRHDQPTPPRSPLRMPHRRRPHVVNAAHSCRDRLVGANAGLCRVRTRTSAGATSFWFPFCLWS
jgi:hypothetical protein